MTYPTPPHCQAMVFESACDEVKGSRRLQRIFQIILMLGNKLNHDGEDAPGDGDGSAAGGTGGGAAAFTLRSLLALSQAKAFDKRTTVLSYLVKVSGWVLV